MALGMDDFGDFSSAFPADSISGVDPNGNLSLETVENDWKKTDFGTNISVPTVAKTGETVILPQSTDTILTFDVFGSCPLDSKDGGEMPNFADFGQFNMNIADITIPNPGTIDVGNGILEIPPFPDDLQFASNSSTEAGIGENGQRKQPLMGESQFINPSSSLGATERGSYQSSPLASTLDSNQSSRESGISIVPSSTAATTTAGPGPGPLRAEDSSGLGPAVQSVTDDNRTSQDLHEQDDEFGDFESSFNQPMGVTSLGQSSDAVEAVTESRTVNEGESFAAFGDMQSTTEGGDWSSGFGNFASMSSQQQDNMPDTHNKNANGVGTLSGVSVGFSAKFGDFDAFQQTTQTESSDFQVSGTNSEPTSQEGETASEKKDTISTHNSRNETSLFSTSDSTPISSGQVANTDTGSKPPSDTEFGNFEAFASCSDTPAFSGFTKFEPSSTEASQISAKKEEEDLEFGEFSSSGDDFGTFSGGRTASSNFSPTPTPPPAAVKINAVKECGGVLVLCFSASNGATDDLPRFTLGSLENRLKLTDTSAAGGTKSVWQSVQKSVDFTVPLYKWNKSYMQQHYYGSLNIDPMLLPRPGALPVFASGLEPLSVPSVPLGSQSAAEDLMESFGFESELEPQGEAASEGRNTFRQDSEESAAPALLDLSLPPTPSAETQKDSFTLTADLLGLDLNPHRKLTSIEELLINERLVVNRSTWMDSQLLELEAREGGETEGPATSQQSSTTSASQPSTPALAKKQPSLEQQLLQLGLDASKTSFAIVSEQKELSFSSQSVLGRLPDLSFMLSDVLVQTHYKK